MGTGRTFGEAYAKAQAASESPCRAAAWCSSACVSVTSPAPWYWRRDWSRRASRSPPPTAPARAINDAGFACKRANKVREGRPHIVDMIKNDEFAMIVNTTEGKTAIRESNSIRREAVHKRVTYYTTSRARSQPAKLSITWMPWK